MNVAYVRVSSADQHEDRQLKAVSSADQHEDRQLKALEPYGIEKYFIEKVSGKNRNREQLKAALEFVRDGDVLYVADFSRLARNVRDLLSIAELLKENKVRLVSLKENIDTDTANGKLMFTLIGAIAEFERENLLERQREGIEIAKSKGVYQGRKKKEAADFEKYYALYQKREITKKKMAELLKVSRPTFNFSDTVHGSIVGRIYENLQLIWN